MKYELSDEQVDIILGLLSKSIDEDKQEINENFRLDKDDINDYKYEIEFKTNIYNILLPPNNKQTFKEGLDILDDFYNITNKI